MFDAGKPFKCVSQHVDMQHIGESNQLPETIKYVINVFAVQSFWLIFDYLSGNNVSFLQPYLGKNAVSVVGGSMCHIKLSRRQIEATDESFLCPYLIVKVKNTCFQCLTQYFSTCK